MAAEGARDNRGIFRIGTRPREVVSVITPSPTRPEVKPQPSPPPLRQPDKRPTLIPEKEKKKGKLLGRLVLAGGLALFATGVGVLTTKLTGDNSQEIETSGSFDPTKDEGTMGPSNTIFIPREELKNYPDFDENGNPLIVVAVSKDKEIGYERSQSDTRGLLNTDTVKNVLVQKDIPAGENIPAPHDGYMFFQMGVIVDQVGRSTPIVRGFTTLFKNPEGNWDIVDVYAGNRSGKASVQALTSAPDWIEASVSKTSALTSLADLADKGTVVHRGDPILSTTQEVNVTYTASATSPDNKNLGKNGFRPITPLTASSNSTTELKLVAPES